MTTEKRYCLQCDEKHIHSELEYTRKDLVAQAGDKCNVVRGVLGYHCSICGECEFSGDEGKRYADAIEKLKTINI